VPKSVVLLAWTLVGFETGLRFSDIHHLKRSDIRNDTITVVCQKTGKLACRRISDECQRALYEMCRRSPDETVFLWALSRRHAFVTWKKFLKWAGMEGSSKWLRRSGATAVESISPGAAQHFLGHSSADLARRHYIDPSLLPPVISPPPLKLAATG
jgi:integrase